MVAESFCWPPSPRKFLRVRNRSVSRLISLHLDVPEPLLLFLDGAVSLRPLLFIGLDVLDRRASFSIFPGLLFLFLLSCRRRSRMASYGLLTCPVRDGKFGSTKDRLQEVAILFFLASSFGLHGAQGVPEGIPVCLLVAPLWLWSSLSSPFVREVSDNRQVVGPTSSPVFQLVRMSSAMSPEQMVRSGDE